MHIILVSSRLATARSITLKLRHMLLAGTALALFVVALATLFSYVTVRHAAEIQLPFLQSLVLSAREHEARKTQEFLRENLNAMAARVGQLQARLMHLDSLEERLGEMAGIKSPDAKIPARPGQGGPLVAPSDVQSAAELQRQMDVLSRQLESRSDYLGLLESELMEERVRKNLLPTMVPVDAEWRASSFGWRNDPFTGQRAMHEGIDFTAHPGTEIVAAAGGIVAVSEHHPQYGKMVEIDHGNGLATRYAHASRLFVERGAIVKRGQKIAAVGSTGRSTGPHLHFEVRYNGVAQNPNRFLKNAQKHRGSIVASHN